MRIVSVGRYVPPRVLTNEHLCQLVDTSDEWIVTRTGISQRHIADHLQTTSDLAAAALRHALERGGLSASSLDALIVATSTPDRFFPATAVRTAELVGLRKDVAAFDLIAACAGFNYGLEVAAGLLARGYSTVALVGAEMLSKFINWKDRSTCVLFGDGAGALILTQSERGGLLAGKLFADGSLAHLLEIPSGAAMDPAGKERFIRMTGREVFKYAVTLLSEAINELLTSAGIEPAAIRFAVGHQANKRILSAVSARTGLGEDKLVVNIGRYGNTSAASIPLALAEIWDTHTLKDGDLLLFFSFGAGFVWGVHLYEHTTS